MPVLNRLRNTTFPEVLPQSSPSHPLGCSEPKTIDPWDYGFERLVPLLQSPPFGAEFLALSLFFLIVFLSDVLLAQITIATLGITVTVSTAGILALVILILFLL